MVGLIKREFCPVLRFGPTLRGEQSVGSGLRFWEECEGYAVSETNDANHFIQGSGVAQRSVMKEEIRNVYRE